jgi:hypothetical protein
MKQHVNTRSSAHAITSGQLVQPFRHQHAHLNSCCSEQPLQTKALLSTQNPEQHNTWLLQPGVLLQSQPVRHSVSVYVTQSMSPLSTGKGHTLEFIQPGGTLSPHHQHTSTAPSTTSRNAATSGTVGITAEGSLAANHNYPGTSSAPTEPTASAAFPVDITQHRFSLRRTRTGHTLEFIQPGEQYIDISAQHQHTNTVPSTTRR